jgi:serine/threonine-protein kinase HipA
MNDCRLFFDGERRHFMTKRFDRDGERKLHLQSLCALGHFDFNQPDANSYDQAFMALPALNLGEEAARRIFRRMVFNVMARNQDDHTKNISFLMDGRGVWALAPAYDMTLAFNHDGAWTCRHQMAVNGKFDGFSRDDLMAVAERNGVNEAVRIIDEVAEAIAHWPDFAAQTDLSSKRVEEIGAVHRRL